MKKNSPSRQRLTGYNDSAHERAPPREHKADLRESGAEDELGRPGLGRGLRLERRDHHPQHRQEERDRHDPRDDAPAHPAGHLPSPTWIFGCVSHRRGGHTPASSNWKTRANIRSANVATMIVRMTVITPAAAAPPTLNAKFTCWYR